MNEQGQPFGDKPCPECGGRLIKAQARPYVLQLVSESATGFIKPLSGTVALVCIDCGLISWYATEVQKLIE